MAKSLTNWVACAALIVCAAHPELYAQTGIGVTTPTHPLHVGLGPSPAPTDEPLRVEGLKASTANDTLVLVADPVAGIVRYRNLRAFAGDVNTDAQTLSVGGGNLSISGGNAVPLSAFGDNLGDHTATENIRLNGNWLSRDGDSEGVFVGGNGATTIRGVTTDIGLRIPRFSPLTAFGGGALQLGVDRFLALDSTAIQSTGIGGIGPKRLDLNPFGGAVATGSDLRVAGAHDLRAAGGATFNEAGANADFRVETPASTHMLFVSGTADAVGIGTSAITAGTLLEVGGKTRTTNFQMTAGGTAGYVLQSDAQGNGTWVASTGIGTDNQTLSTTATDLVISGGNSVPLSALGDDLGDHVADQNLRLNGNWLTGDGDPEGLAIDGNGSVTFRTQTGSPGITVVRSASATAFGNGGVVVGRQEIVSVDTAGIQSTSTASGPKPLALNPFGGDVVVAATSGIGVRTFDNHNRTRLRVLDVGAASDEVLTVDAAGNVRKRSASDVSSLHWSDAGGNDIYNTAQGQVAIGLTTPIVDLDVDGDGLFRRRLALGVQDARFVEDPLPGGVNEGMHISDGAVFVPVFTGSQTSDLRLYIPNDSNDIFSIWGNNCQGGGDCGDMFAGLRAMAVQANGRVTLDGLSGTDTRMVVAYSTGELSTQAVPTDAQTLSTTATDLVISGGNSVPLSSLGDNLGNHTATQTLNLDGQWINGDADPTEGLTVDADGDVGIGTLPGNYLFYASNTTDREPFAIASGQTTGERDVFSVIDDDNGGGGQDHSSVIKAWKRGSINAGDLGFSLVELVQSTGDPGAGGKYWISGRHAADGAPTWGVDVSSDDIWTTGSLQVGSTGNVNGSYAGGASFVNADGSAVFNDGGAAVDFRVEGDAEANLLVVDGSADAIGVGTDAPLSVLDLRSSADVSNTGVGGVLRIGDGTRSIIMDRDELNAYNGTAKAGLNLQADGGPVLVGVNSPGTSSFRAYGAVTFSGIGTVTDDAYLLSANAAGAVRRIAKADATAAFGDDLGDHTATQTLNLDGNHLSGDGDAEGIWVDNDGDVGIGTASPAGRLNVEGGALVLGDDVDYVTATNGLGAERVRYTGSNSNLVMGIEDGTSRVNWRWNSELGTNGSASFLKTGDYAVRMRIHADPSVNTDPGGTDSNSPIWDIARSSARGVAGSPVTWETRLAVTTNGEVGVGTAAPDARLHVFGTEAITTSGGGLLRVGEGGNFTLLANNTTQAFRSGSVGDLSVNALGGQVLIGEANSGDMNDIIQLRSTVFTDTVETVTNMLQGTANEMAILLRRPNGEVVKIFKSDFDAIVSDSTLKYDIAVNQGGLTAIRELDAYTFRYQGDNSAHLHHGVIAQEVEAVYPELVVRRADGTLAVKYEELTPVLLSAVKTLDAQLQSERDRNDALEIRLAKLEAAIGRR